jgi:pilus assembly protein CpaE
MSSAKLLLYIVDESLRWEARETLRRFDNAIRFDQHDGDWASLLEQIAETKPEVLLLDVSAVPVELNIGMRQIRYHVPRIKVIAIHSNADPKTILSAVRAGADEFIHPPLAEDLQSALERVLSSPSPSLVPVHRGKVIGFLSAKGGCGATTIACHLARELREVTQKKVLLADLDLISGLVGFIMKASNTYSVVDAIKNLTRLDESLWRALIVEQKDSFSILPAPASFAPWDNPNEEQMRQVLQFMRTQHDWVVLDLGHGPNAMTTAVLDEVDQLFLVSTLEVLALHGLKEIVSRLFEKSEKVQFVLNRTPKTMDISTQEIEKILGRAIYAALPNDYMGLYQCYSSGNLLNPNNRLAHCISLLAAKVAGVSSLKSKKKFALFG